MGRPQINESFADRYGTLHSMTVKPDKYGWQALARLCYLGPNGDWVWVNRRLNGETAEEALEGLLARVTDVLGCRSKDETNALTNGLHAGHKHVSPGQLPS